MEYTTGQALETRLKRNADETGTSYALLRKQVTFERLLARLVKVAPERWVVKGAQALAYRLSAKQRPSKDIDIAWFADDPESAHKDLLQAASVDLDDYFSFKFQRLPSVDIEHGNTTKFSLECYIGGRVFEKSGLDVAVEKRSSYDELERVEVPNYLAFAEIPTLTVPIVPIEQHLADKLHAYTRQHGHQQQASTREKDLVDIVLMLETQNIDGDKLRTALRETYEEHGEIPPYGLPAVPENWGKRFAALAETVGIDAHIDKAYEAAKNVLNPILTGSVKYHHHWDYRGRKWIEQTLSSEQASGEGLADFCQYPGCDRPLWSKLSRMRGYGDKHWAEITQH